MRTDSFPAQFVEPLNFGWIEVGIVNAEIIQPPLELTPVVVSRTGDAETERRGIGAVKRSAELSPGRLLDSVDKQIQIPQSATVG